MLRQRFVPVPAGQKHIVRFAAYGGLQQIQFGVRKQGAGVTADSVAAVNEIVRDWLNDADTRALFPDEVTAVDIVGTDESDQHGARVVRAAGIAGTAAGPAIAPNVSAVASFHTTRRGRSYRGRSYWPYPLVAQLASPGILTGGAAGDIAAAYENLRLSIEAGAAFFLAVFSRSAGYVTDETNPDRPKVRARALAGNGFTTDVTAVTVNPQLRTQRRRAIGIGA